MVSTETTENVLILVLGLSKDILNTRLISSVGKQLLQIVPIKSTGELPYIYFAGFFPDVIPLQPT